MLVNRASVQRDPSGLLTVEDVAEGSHKDAFHPLSGSVVEGTTAHEVLWVRIALARAADAPDRWLLSVQPPALDQVTLFAPGENNDFSTSTVGDRLPFAQREIRDNELIFPITLDTRERVFYLRIESTAFNSLQLGLWQHKGFEEHQSQEAVLVGLILGAAVAMLLLNLIFWRWLRDSLYLQYAGFLIATAYLVVISSGYFARFTSAEPLLADRGLGVAICVYNFMAIVFVSRIFELKRQTPRAWQAFRAVGIFNLLMLLVALTGQYGRVAWWVDASLLFVTLVGWGAILHLVLARRQWQYVFPMVAFSPSAVACIVRAVEALGIWDFDAGASISLGWRTLALMAHLLLLNIAVANRTRVAEANYRRERRRALALARRSERELGAEVRLRINKLAETNAALRGEVARRSALEGTLVNSLEAEHATLEMQRNLVSMVSHEFRTPLAIIDAAADALRRSPLGSDAFVKPRTEKIKRSVERLSLLVENVLAKDKLDTGSLATRFHETFDLNELVLNAQAAVGERDGTRLVLRTHDAPMPVRGDRPLLEIVLQNLVQNALKYSPPDSEVAIESSQRDGMAQVEVRDRGIGIPEEEQSELFQKYFRASPHRRRPGTGLGLHISREIARQHGGDVALASSGDGGSVFRLSLPVRPQT